MNYVLLLLIYLIHSFAYIYSMSNSIIMVVSGVLFMVIFLNMKKHNISIGARLVALMAASIPISFRNILGGEFSELPMMWFYVFGALYVLLSILAFANKKAKITINYKGIVLLLTIGFSIIPFIISVNMGDAFKEYLTYLFFFILLFVSIINRNSLNSKEYDLIISYYIFGGIFASLGVIFQYIMFSYFATSYFRIEFYGYYRKYFSFMFYDMSSATVYMATVAFFLLFSKKKRKALSIIMSILVIIAMAISSARAGLASLFVVLIMFTLVKKGFVKKIGLLIVLGVFAVISIYILNDVRGLESTAAYVTYDAGRFKGYIDGLYFFFASPIFGVGYDLGDQMKTAGLVVPHFALINLLAQTGLIITLLTSYIIYWVYREARNKGLENLKWVILIALIGSCIIPGFFNSRFFTVLAMLPILKIKMGSTSF